MARAGDPPATLNIDVVDEPLMLQAAGPATAAQTAPNSGAQAAPCITVQGRGSDRVFAIAGNAVRASPS